MSKNGCEIQTVDMLTGELITARFPREAANVAEKARALVEIARALGLKGRELNRGQRVRIEAMAKAGELLAATLKHGGSRSRGVTLPDGIDKMQSSRWQAIARVPAEVRADYFAECDELDEEITAAGVLQQARCEAREQKQAAASKPAAENDAAADSLDEFVAAGTKFGCIYADPPWKYGNQGTRASTDNHYPTQTVEEICAMPVRDIAADNAHLHLWSTNAFLFEARRVIEAWGFEYKSCFVWVKPQMGIGNYWRVSHEFLLLGVRGRAPFLARNEMSWREFRRGKHSAKPDQVRAIIERVSPGPRIELYSRLKVDGWSAWGNEVQTDLLSRRA